MRLEAHDLHYEYPAGVTALDGVSLQIETGDSVAIMGENGAGKTTLAKHFNGLLKPQRGWVRVGDWDTADLSPADLAARIGFSFQNPDDQLFERTVDREIAFGPRNLGLVEDEVQWRVRRAAERVGLADQLDTHPYDLHATQRKFVALAATLALQTPILVIDEPTTGQDARGIAKLHRLLGDLRADGHTLITISHDVDFCAENFERGVLMAGGIILADGPMRSVLNQQQELSRAAIEPPQMLRLANALALESTPLTVDDFLQAYRTSRRGPGGSE